MRINVRTPEFRGAKRSPNSRIKLIKYQIKTYGTQAKKFFKYEEKV